MITAIGNVMQKCYERGWITTRDGNASLRRKGSKCMYITPSGMRKNTIRVEDIIKLTLSDNGSHFVVPNGSSPSGEFHMHHKLLIGGSETRAILHVHPTHVVAAMYAGFDLQKLAEQFPEINRYTKVGPTVPALPATSKELGDATFSALVQRVDFRYDIVGQANHGVCAVAKDPWSAYEHVERLDHMCEIVLKSGVRPT